MNKMKIGYFEHWSRPPYSFAEFCGENGIKIEKIDFSCKNYLEGFDAVIIEQHGFNDYIENDEEYFRDWVFRGGTALFLAQDYARWAPCFLPPELGVVSILHRHVPTIFQNGEVTRCYMMPEIEDAGRRLFSEPNPILPEEMIFWKIPVNSFSIIPRTSNAPEILKSAAQCCAVVEGGNWEILGSYRDPAVRNGALILQAKYGKGLYLLNQILFPEDRTAEAAPVFAFWKKYLPNLLAHIKRVRNGEKEPSAPRKHGTLPLKRNYKTAIHLHSLDWYGADSSLGTIAAMMKFKHYDVAAIAVKDATPFGGTLDLGKYSDERVLFLPGQEYHPFNWKDSNEGLGHNTYHILSIGVDDYTQKFTKSLFSDAEIDTYLKEALEFIHSRGGVACATHPYCGFWTDYPFDAVDMEPLGTLAGSAVETYWMSGKRITIMNSVDLFGIQRILENPAVNFLYTEGIPDRDSIAEAVRRGRNIAATGFSEAHIALNSLPPGSEIPDGDLDLEVSAEAEDFEFKEIRVFADREIICRIPCRSKKISERIPLPGIRPEHFIRVEVEGDSPLRIAVSTPFYRPE